MNEIKKKFQEINNKELYQRVDDIHNLDLYLGVDELSQYSLFMISKEEPLVIYSSEIISVRVGKRKDNLWALSFSLRDTRFEDLFCHFCADLIGSSRSVDIKSKGVDFICNRYLKWQNMLSKYKQGILSQNAIKGLIGELIFLREFLIPIYGEEKAIYSWIGPEFSDQDFVLEDKWYEVKSIVSGAEVINISSVEQLDSNSVGELVIVYLDKTSYVNKNKITLNSIYEEILSSLGSEKLKRKFNEILLNLSYYPQAEYDEYLFMYSKFIRYEVNSDFPCLRRSTIPPGIINAKYELSLQYINKFIRS